MQKYILLLVLVLCMALLSACGAAPSEPVQTEPTIIEAEPAEITNPFLSGKYVDHPTDGGGVCRVYYIPKETALECSAEEYEEFVQSCVALHKGFMEYVTLSFGDGTGVIYFGADPGNCIYGPYGEKCFVSPDTAYGYIVPNGNGTYEYHEYAD